MHLNSLTSVCVRRGFDTGHVGSAAPHFMSDPEGPTEWLPLSAISLWGKTHVLITTGSLVVALCEGIPTCDWGCEAVGGMCEISV